VSRSPEKSILVIRTGALGDTILTLPILDSVKAAHPGEAIVFLGTRAYKDLVPKDIIFYPVDGTEWSWLFAPRPPIPESVPAFRKAYVILKKADDVARNLALAGTRTVVHASPSPPRNKHIIEHMHESLGFPLPKKRAFFRIAAREIVGEPTIWLHPGSGGPKKCAPLKGMVRIVRELQAKTGFRLVITAAEEDAFLKRTSEWGELVAEPGVILMENRPLSEIVTRLGSAALFIGNDSGISHLAANLGISSIVFFVASDPIKWSPWVPEQSVRVIDMRSQSIDGTAWIDAGLHSALDLLSKRSTNKDPGALQSNYTEC
jgi:heptosyltransferase-3